eukprot:12932453-Alexandrium_andersonii.AAC.1
MRRRFRLSGRSLFTSPRGPIARMGGRRRERRSRNRIVSRRDNELLGPAGNADGRARLWVAPNDITR